jgi:hypothetical protein
MAADGELPRGRRYEAHAVLVILDLFGNPDQDGDFSFPVEPRLLAGTALSPTSPDICNQL